MPHSLIFAAGVLVAIKLTATLWLVIQPDATTVTHSRLGRLAYIASKVTPAMFAALFLAYAITTRAGAGQISVFALLLIVAIAMAWRVARLRTRGQWYGLAHQLRQRRRRD